MALISRLPRVTHYFRLHHYISFSNQYISRFIPWAFPMFISGQEVIYSFTLMHEIIDRYFHLATCRSADYHVPLGLLARPQLSPMPPTSCAAAILRAMPSFTFRSFHCARKQHVSLYISLRPVSGPYFDSAHIHFRLLPVWPSSMPRTTLQHRAFRWRRPVSSLYFPFWRAHGFIIICRAAWIRLHYASLFFHMIGLHINIVFAARFLLAFWLFRDTRT